MTVYVFDAAKQVRKIIPPNGVTELVHDEAYRTINATVAMSLTVKNGEHLGFMCVDGRFRLFTVTRSENHDDTQTTIITATDAAVQELMEIVVEEKQQLDVTLTAAIQGLLDASGATGWIVTGAEPDRLEKSRAYFSTLWAMLETYMTLYEWNIVPYFLFYGGRISGRVIALEEDKAVFRGRILQSRKDASNVYVIRNNPPITRLYGVGPATGSGDVQTNMTFADEVWSTGSGDPVDKPKGQCYVDDAGAIAKYGIHTAVISLTEVETEDDLLQKTWEELQKRKEPACTVEATIQDLERVPGYENQIIRLGDLVPIRLTNATMEEARVINIKRDYIRQWLTKIVIGEKTATIQTQMSGLIADAAHTFERLTIYKNRFHEDEALIQLNAEMIQMNAEVIEMNAKEIRANAELIDLKAGREEVTELGERVSAAEIKIDGIEAEILLKASQKELTEVEGRLSSAEIRIDGAEAAIALKAEQSTVTVLEQRLSQAEIDIDGANAQINLKASQSTVDALGERVTSAELLIDGQNSKIEAKADLILLDGYVKTSELETEVLTVVDTAYILGSLSGEMIDVQSLVAASVNTEYMSADSITADSMRVGGNDLVSASLTMGPTTATLFAPSNIDLSHSHAVTVEGGKVTLGEVSSSGGSFNIADTQFYKDGVSAAKDSVTLSSAGWYGGTNVVSASNGKSLTVELPPFKTSGGDTFASNKTTVYFYTDSVSSPLASKEVDASSVYNSGYNGGYSSGQSSVTLSAAGWVGGSNVVSASNGKSVTVNLPSFSTSGGTSFNSSYQTTVYFYTSSVSSPLASRVVDASSVYEAGRNGAKPIAIGRSATYDAASNVYKVTATVITADGAAYDFSLADISATAAYNAGWNDCRDACTLASQVYTIKEYAPGTLYMLVNGYYTSVGSDWVRTTPATVYNRPAAKT